MVKSNLVGPKAFSKKNFSNHYIIVENPSSNFHKPQTGSHFLKILEINPIKSWNLKKKLLILGSGAYVSQAIS